MIKAKSQFKQRSIANNVEIVIPVPADADTPSFKTSIGTVKYAPERDAIVWSIKQFHGAHVPRSSHLTSPHPPRTRGASVQMLSPAVPFSTFTQSC